MEQEWKDDDFASYRIANWEANAFHWASYVDCCHLRTTMFQSIISRFCNLYGNHHFPSSILDMGCGEGTFLRVCHSAFPSARLVGLDFCTHMITLAKNRSQLIPSVFVHGDFESTYLPLQEKFDFVTAILSLIEASDLSRSFKNISSLLTPRGVCAIAILDPMNEIYRYFKEIRSDKKLVTTNERLLISAHFRAPGGDSPKPYFRFVRPLDEYLKFAFDNGLKLDHVYPIIDESHDVPTNLQARVVILFFSPA